jgi:hypothetical protein
MKEDILEIIDDHINSILEMINEENDQSLSQETRAKLMLMKSEIEEQLGSAYDK